MNRIVTVALLAASLGAVTLLNGCASTGYGRAHYGAYYGSYYGRSPWYGYRQPPIYIDGGARPELPIEPPPIDPGRPEAVPLPDMGMPDMDFGGGMDFGGDIGF